jgi:methanogenic corrinoid protein MtbC1
MSVVAEAGKYIDEQAVKLANLITDKQFELNPELEKRYGAAGKLRCLEDARYHLSYLSEALRADSPLLFTEYCAWAKVLLLSRNIPVNDLENNLNILEQTLKDNLPEESAGAASKFVRSAIGMLHDLPSETVNVLHEDNPHGLLADNYLELLLTGQRQEASRLIMEAVRNGIYIRDIYMNVFQKVQYEVGRLWQTNEITVAQEHYCTAATQLIMSQLYSYIMAEARKPFKIVATCVEGDYHEMGIRMVSDMFELEGWQTYYLGANAPIASVISSLMLNRPDILLVSATMVYHVKAVKSLIEKVRATSGFEKVKIMVGGYPFKLDPELWKKIGADGFADSALEALDVANKLVKVA